MKTLLVISGPTGVGKTALSLDVAATLRSDIVNADSRQIYRELPIGTAAPTAEEQKRIKHWFVGIKSVTEDYNAGMYERDALSLIRQMMQKQDIVVMTGGSMMYIDAVCSGLDMLPEVSPETRSELTACYQERGLGWLQTELQRLDPQYYSEVDTCNPQRLLHALEIIREAGVPYSQLRQGEKAQREFCIIMVCLQRERSELYERINSRVLHMMQAGLEDEARSVYPYKGLNSLNTVGYKEMFQYFDGDINRDDAVRLIQQHSRNYAKRQLTWWRNRHNDITWFDAGKVTTGDILALTDNRHI